MRQELFNTLFTIVSYEETDNKPASTGGSIIPTSTSIYIKPSGTQSETADKPSEQKTEICSVKMFDAMVLDDERSYCYQIDNNPNETSVNNNSSDLIEKINSALSSLVTSNKSRRISHDGSSDDGYPQYIASEMHAFVDGRGEGTPFCF